MLSSVIDMGKILLEATVETLAPWTIFHLFISFGVIGILFIMDEKHISGRAKFCFGI